MKSFFKKIAFIMAMAMVLTNIGPIAKASAAATPSLKYTSKVLYIDGGSLFDGYTDSCWTPSQNTEGYKVSYAVTEGKDIVTVATNGKVTAIGDKIGKAVITVTYDNGVDKATTTKFTIKVRRNATDVILRKVTRDKIEEPLAVGSEIELTAAKSAVTPAYYKAGTYGIDNYMGVVSDQIAYKVSDESVIKVEGNKLTAVGAGTATLTVYTYQYTDKLQREVVSKDYTIVVAGGMKAVEQTAVDTLKITMAGALEATPALTDFVITQAETNITVSAMDISLDDTKTVATVKTFMTMADGKEYTVKYGDQELKFTATDGVVADIAINRATVPYDTDTDMVVYLKDANGVIVEAIDNLAGTDRTDVAVEITKGYGYQSGGKLNLIEKGDTAKISVTYHSQSYNSETGLEEGNITKDFVVTAIERDAVTVGDIKYTVKGNDDVPDWDSVAKDNMYYANLGAVYYAHVYLKNSAGADLTQDDNYTLTSSNSDVLIVASAAPSKDGGKGICAQVIPVGKAGATAYVVVKDKNGATKATIPVTVREASKYTNYTLSTATVELTNSSAIEDTSTVEIKFFDQYGAGFDKQKVDITIVSKPANAGKVTDTVNYGGNLYDYDIASGKITFNGKYVAPGSYQYRITSNNINRSINVVVKEPNASATAVYKLVFSTTNIDTVVNSDSKGDQNVTVKVGLYRNGVLESYLKADEFTVNSVKNPSGTDVKGNSIVTVTGTAITVNVRSVSTVTGTAVTKQATGTYTVSLKVNNRAGDLTGTFVVADTQLPISAKVESKTVSAANYEDLLAKTKFYYNGGEVTSKVTIVSVDTATNGTQNAGTPIKETGKQVFIKSVTVTMDVEGLAVTFSVPVGMTFDGSK